MATVSAVRLLVTEDGTLMADGVESIYVVVVDGVYSGIDVCGPQAERQLLPLVGPTVWCLARYLVANCGPAGEVVPIHRLARALGVPTAKVRQSIKRGARFGMFDLAPGAVGVPRRWTDPKGKIR